MHRNKWHPKESALPHFCEEGASGKFNCYSYGEKGLQGHFCTSSGGGGGGTLVKVALELKVVQ